MIPFRPLAMVESFRPRGEAQRRSPRRGERAYVTSEGVVLESTDGEHFELFQWDQIAAITLESEAGERAEALTARLSDA